MILFSALFGACWSLSLSIDIGSDNLRSSYMNRGEPITIVPNKEGKRFTPSVFTVLPHSTEEYIITPNNTNYFDFSFGNVNLYTRYPKNSSKFLPQILGKNYSKVLFSYLAKRNLTMAIDSDQDNYLELFLSPEFYASYMISKSIEDVKRVKVNCSIDSVGIIVPKFFTHHQRKSFIKSSKLSNFNPIIVNNTAAVSHIFGLEKSSFFRNRKINVLFIDIGASQFQAFICEFYKRGNVTTIEELSYQYSDTIGSYVIDVKLAKIIKDQFVLENPEVRLDDKSEQVILNSARMLKHELTLFERADILIEDLVPGMDFSFSYDRAGLKLIVAKELKIIHKIVQRAIDDAKKLRENLIVDRIELIGAGSRSPIFAEFLNETFNIAPSHSLPQDEATVIGSGYYLASLKTDYLAQIIDFYPLSSYTICNITRGKIMTFYYNESHLPIGVSKFISSVELGKNSKIYFSNGIVKTKGCRKLTRSGLFKEKFAYIKEIIQAFDEKERINRDSVRKLHEIDSFLIDIKDKLTTNPSIHKLSTEQERVYLFEKIASLQYQIQSMSVDQLDIDDLLFKKSQIESSVTPLLEKAESLEDGPYVAKKLKELIKEVEESFFERWPYDSLQPTPEDKRLLSSIMTEASNAYRRYKKEQNVSVIEMKSLLEKLRVIYKQISARLIPTGDSSSDL